MGGVPNGYRNWDGGNRILTQSDLWDLFKFRYSVLVMLGWEFASGEYPNGEGIGMFNKYGQEVNVAYDSELAAGLYDYYWNRRIDEAVTKLSNMEGRLEDVLGVNNGQG